MRDFVIMSDANCDLPRVAVDECNLRIVPMMYTDGNDTYAHSYSWDEMPPTEFYDNMRNGKMYSTIPLTVERAKDAMVKEIEAGHDILWVSFSGALSSTFSAVTDAAQEVRAEHREAKVLVVDSLSACLGQGMLLYLCAKEKESGADIEAVRAFAEATKMNIIHWFTVDDLSYLRRGGRIGAISAAMGNMLSMKPVLDVDSGGRLHTAYKSRGRRSALSNLVSQLELSCVDTTSPLIFIGHADAEADVEFVTQEIMSRFSEARVSSSWIGPNIGAHAGPGTLAIFFVGNSR